MDERKTIEKPGERKKTWNKRMESCNKSSFAVTMGVLLDKSIGRNGRERRGEERRGDREREEEKKKFRQP